MKIVIKDLIKHNPLIWPNQDNVLLQPNHPHIFLGGGVATQTKISKAAPFDLLGFMLTAEQVKRATGGNVHLLIADQHAWLANNLDRELATQAANNLKVIIQQIITHCNLTNWCIHLASDIFPNAINSNYESLEVRDIIHFVENYNVGLKISWIFSPKEIGITDESHFDMLHSLPTILIKPGLTDDPAKPHESPYICTDPTKRITFSSSNNWDISPAMKNHLRNICVLFESLVEPYPPKTPVEQKINVIINQIINKENT